MRNRDRVCISPGSLSDFEKGFLSSSTLSFSGSIIRGILKTFLIDVNEITIRELFAFLPLFKNIADQSRLGSVTVRRLETYFNPVD